VKEREHPLGRRITRRSALTWLGGLGLAAFVPGCTGDDSSGGATTTSAGGPTTGADSAAGTTGSSAAADCVLMPELTEGPFYIDLERVRSDITEGKPGLPLNLRINVLDVDACETIKDAAVDIWHCDAGGCLLRGQRRRPEVDRGPDVLARDPDDGCGWRCDL
jgi:hypothetical protein